MGVLHKEVVSLTATQQVAPVQTGMIQREVQRAWTRRRVINVAIAESGYSRRDVVACINSLTEHVQRMVRSGVTRWRPDQRWLDKHHDVLVAIIPDNAVSEPGTAHRGVEEISKPKGFDGVITILHDMRAGEGRVMDCYVTVTTRSSRLN
jgi:hypothetical protein